MANRTAVRRYRLPLWSGLIAMVLGLAAHAVCAADADRLMQMAERLDSLEAELRYRELEAAAKEYFAFAERPRSPIHMAIGMRSLGTAFKGQQKLAESEAAYQQALRLVTERRFTPDSQRVANNVAKSLYLQLGQILNARGKYRESEASFLSGIKLVEATSGRDSIDLAPLLIDLAALDNTLSRYDAALERYDRAEAIIRGQEQPDLDLLTYVLHGRAVNSAHRHRYDEAVQLYRQELDLLNKLYGPGHHYSADVLLAMAQSHKAQRRLSEAAPLLEQAIAIFNKVYGPDNLKIAAAQLTLASIQSELGRYAEAETLYRQSLAVREKVLGDRHVTVAESLSELATLYLYQDRDAEAVPLLERSIAIYEQALGPDNPKIQNGLMVLIQAQRNLKLLEAAEQSAARLIGICEKTDPDLTYEAWHLLATVYRAQQKYDRALELYQRALEGNAQLAEKKGSIRLDLKRGVILESMALLYYSMQRKQESADYHRRALQLQEQVGVPPGALAVTLVTYAEVLYELGRQQEALPLIERAMHLIEQQRTSYSGGDTDRAEAFKRSAVIYEYAIRIHSQLQNLPAAFEAMERGQARSLLDQMATQNIDLFEGMPPATAQPLRQRLETVGRQLAAAESQLEQIDLQPDLAVDAYRAQRGKLVAELRQQQGNYAAVQADIRNASPAYRLAVGKDLAVADLATAQEYAAQHNALVLRYFTGYGLSFVMVIEPEGPPTISELSTSDSLAERLGVAAGRLHVDLLNSVLANDAGTGVLQQLRSPSGLPAAQAVTERLAALWELLVPVAQRQAITAGKFDQLIVIPDGPLAMLPFDALVVEAGDAPQYLLDVGPPIVYAPSVTILQNLLAREVSTPGREASKVLTVGDPAYGQVAGKATANSRATPVAQSPQRAGGGQLARLPYSALEVGWIAEVFQKQGIQVDKLLAQSATEGKVRAELPGCTIVHFACHGLVDTSYSNLFGALALTSVKSAVADPKNDGYLTLGEIYGLDLHRCELAILSACDTNFGPRQQGEGVWALSRGFLVAGSRRVVASNWYVDDQAAASLVSYFCSLVAKPIGQGEAPQYAVSLHEAKRWVRQQPKWSSPTYWATFVMLGPN